VQLSKGLLVSFSHYFAISKPFSAIMTHSSRSVLGTINEGNLGESTIHIKKRKSVSFHGDVLVYKEWQYSTEDRVGMFYTRDDIRSFSSEIREYQLISKTLGMPFLLKNNMNTNGLETFLSSNFMEHKKRHKLQAVLAVLMEQDRQYKELGYITPIDFESMSHLYHQATDESQKEAHERALQYRAIQRLGACSLQANTTTPQAA
jgi:hypothetical protein